MSCLVVLWAKALMVAIALCASPGCNRHDGPRVVLYSSADEHVVRIIVEAFQKQTGIQVMLVTDSELKKTTGLIDRLRSERNNPQADVFWSSEIFMTIDLANEGVLAPHVSPLAQSWPAAFRDTEHRWHGFAARARVIVYAPDRVPADAIPQTWMDLTQPRFKDRIVMADPRFGTTGGHLAAMETYWTRDVMPGYYAAFLDGLRDNNMRMLPSGNAGVVRAVADGEADVGMTDTDDVWAAQANGLNVKHVYARHHADADEQGTGTLLIPNTVARIKGGPNEQAAATLIDFLLSEQVERLLFESESHNVSIGPARPSLTADLGPYAVPDPLRIDFALVASRRAAAVETAMTMLSQAAAAEPPAIDRAAVEAMDRQENPLDEDAPE